MEKVGLRTELLLILVALLLLSPCYCSYLASGRVQPLQTSRTSPALQAFQ